MGNSVDSGLDTALIERAVGAARIAVETEVVELMALLTRLDAQIERSLTAIFQCKGRVVVTGLGKSGHIGAKISATFSSTGTPSFFLHSTEALHGDLGVLVEGDLLIAISNSGETAEVCAVSRKAKDSGIYVIAMTGKTSSTLAKIADHVLDISVSREADPLNVAPTSSTTITLAFGDALASALMVARNFTVQDFAKRHPDGALGKQLSSPDLTAEQK